MLILLLAIDDQNLTDVKEKIRTEFLDKIELEDWETQVNTLLRLQEIQEQEKSEFEDKAKRSKSIENTKRVENVENNSDDEESKNLLKDRSEDLKFDSNGVQIKRTESRLKSICFFPLFKC